MTYHIQEIIKILWADFSSKIARLEMSGPIYSKCYKKKVSQESYIP